VIRELRRHLDLVAVERDVEAQAAGGGVVDDVAVALVAHVLAHDGGDRRAEGHLHGARILGWEGELPY
jgi:hypothetical protein